MVPYVKKIVIGLWDGLDINGKYDDECQCMIIPEGWYEYRNFNSEGVYNNKINENVIAWQILPRYHIPGYVTMNHMQWCDDGNKYVCELTDELDKIVFDTKHKVVHHYVYALDKWDIALYHTNSRTFDWIYFYRQ